MALANNFSSSLFSKSGFGASLSTPAPAFAFAGPLPRCLLYHVAVTTIGLVSIDCAAAFAAYIAATPALLAVNGKFPLHSHYHRL